MKKTGFMTITEDEKKLVAIVTQFPEATMFIRILVLVLNVIIPGIPSEKETFINEHNKIGLGTMVMAFQYNKQWVPSKTQLVIGLIQMLTWGVYVGWVWAIAWGGLFLWKGMRKPAPVSQGPPKIAVPQGMVAPGMGTGI